MNCNHVLLCCKHGSLRCYVVTMVIWLLCLPHTLPAWSNTHIQDILCRPVSFRTRTAYDTGVHMKLLAEEMRYLIDSWTQNRSNKIGPLVLGSFGIFHEIRRISWVKYGRFHDEIQWISWNLADFMKSGRFHNEIRQISCEIQLISWKKQISKCKILKTFITFLLWNKSQQFLDYR